MRSVPIKTDDQLDLQSLHRVRCRMSWTVKRMPMKRKAIKPRGPSAYILEDNESGK